MPGEKGDVGDMVSDLCHLLPLEQHHPEHMCRLNGLTLLSLHHRAALEILVLLVIVE